MSTSAKSKKIVAVSTSTLTLVAGQSDSVQVLDIVTGFVTTLPAATAAITGTTYKFIVQLGVTSNSYTIKGATSADIFYGGVALISNSTSPYAIGCPANGSTHYQLVMSGTTTGGLVGTAVTFTCLGLNAWAVDGLVLGSGTITATGLFA